MGLYLGISVFFILLDLFLLEKTVKEHKPLYRLIATSFGLAIVMLTAYLLSLATTSVALIGFYDGIYQIILEELMFCFLLYARKFGNSNFKRINKSVLGILLIFKAVSELGIMTNPLTHWFGIYSLTQDSVMPWMRDPGFMFQFHIVVCNLISFAIFGQLLYRALKSPKVYWNKYWTIFSCFVTGFVFNSVYFLIIRWPTLDYMLFFYSVLCLIIFWYNNRYLGVGNLDKAREMILEEINHPIILFDYKDRLLMSNHAADFLIQTEWKKNSGNELTEFMTFWGLEEYLLNSDTNRSFQCTISQEGMKCVYRCDYTVLRDNKERPVGKLLIFTDFSLECDLLTGFYSETFFRIMFSSNPEITLYPIGLAICDINRLGKINQSRGREVGDKAIQLLAHAIRENTPEGSCYVRLGDANLLFICTNTGLQQMREYIAKIKESMDNHPELGEILRIQGAIEVATEQNPGVIAAVDAAKKSMKAKKLMDVTSSHSSLLDSMAQILQESDNCTREHVRRTQIMGEKIGMRLGLNDVDLTNLALLCLLHDIGKVGIPIEILNKPGKLNDEEWVMMKSHPEKGYRIAKASEELKDIAELILHHHECWNGKGYPDGLEKESIPLLSRIISVVDTYDAMTNDRPYRTALSTGQACKELIRCAGTQFDPYIVSEFIAMLEEMELYKQEETQVEETPAVNIRPMGLGEELTTKQPLYMVRYSKYSLGGGQVILSVDDNFEKLTGYSRADVEEYSLTQTDLLCSEDIPDYRKLVQAQLSKKHEAFMEHRLRRKDGNYIYVYCHGREYYDSAIGETRTQIVITDISDSISVHNLIDREKERARRSMKRWEDSIRRDPLTMLLNRAAFQNDVQMKLLDDTVIIGMLMLDIDYFKKYNDTYGHKYGDELLIRVAGQLQSSVADFGMASRMGGDEFAAVLCFDRKTNRNVIKSQTREVYDQVAAALKEFDQSVTISMGAYLPAEEVHTFNVLYTKADNALYEAKEAGRAQLTIKED